MDINLLDARQMAEEIFKEHFEKNASLIGNNNWCSEEYLESNSCWLFFKNKEIIINNEQPYSDFVVVITKNGRKIINQDYGGDIDLLTNYLKRVSEVVRSKE